MNFHFLRTNICLVAFWHILFICSAHLLLLDMATPKCLWLSTWFKFSEFNFGFIGFMFCRNEIIIYSVFRGLKSTSHCFTQLSKAWRSKFNLTSISNGLVDENIKELSSAVISWRDISREQFHKYLTDLTKLSIESVILVLIFNGFHTSVAVLACLL